MTEVATKEQKNIATIYPDRRSQRSTMGTVSLRLEDRLIHFSAVIAQAARSTFVRTNKYLDFDPM
jgi:hypothetical protein